MLAHIDGAGPAGTGEDDGGMDSGTADAIAASSSAVAIDGPMTSQHQSALGSSMEASGLEGDSGENGC